MLKERVVFIGVGQGGGNITRELELNDCQAFYINSSLDDLDTIDTSYDKKYHISGTKGMAKDISFAKDVILNDYNDDKAVESVYKAYANASTYFFVFTLSGGTGGGMGVEIATRFKERFPDKTVNIITVLPHADEDMIMHYNAMECLKGINEGLTNDLITNVQILDNSKRDFSKKLEINSEFASMLDKILSFTNITENGNLDEEEFERLFQMKGISVICELDNKNFLDDLSKTEENSIYAKFLRKSQAHGLILNAEQDNSISRNLIREVFGVAMVSHSTIWEEDINIIMSTGVEFNYDELIVDLKKNYSNLLEMKKKIESELNSKTEEVDINLDFSDMKSIQKNNTPAQRPERKTRRGSFGVRGETRFRR